MAVPPASTAARVPPAREPLWLATIGDAGAAPGAVRAAQSSLYTAHAAYLYAALQRKTRLLLLAGTTAEDLVQDSFRRVFERAASYRAGDGDADDERRRFRAWLGRVAERLLLDQLRADRELPDTPLLETLAEEVTPPSSERPQLRALRAAFDQLGEREQDVLRVTALHLHAGEHQRLPNEVASELARRWGTTTDNVRAIRSRALKRLKQLLEVSLPPEGATR